MTGISRRAAIRVSAATAVSTYVAPKILWSGTVGAQQLSGPPVGQPIFHASAECGPEALGPGGTHVVGITISGTNLVPGTLVIVNFGHHFESALADTQGRISVGRAVFVNDGDNYVVDVVAGGSDMSFIVANPCM